MNNKINSSEMMPLEVGFIVTMFFPGIANFLILMNAKNATLISVLIGIILGITPLLMTMYISKKIKNESLSSYLKQKLGLLGSIFNVVLIISALFILFINSWQMIDFIISQFLTRTSYYFITIVFFLIIVSIINKGIETASRTSFILFVITIAVAIILWICLIPSVKIDNLKPFVNTKAINIIKSSFIYTVSTTFPIIYILDLKHITNDKERFEKYILIGYIISIIIVSLSLFFIIAVNTIEVTNILTYPIYFLYKKIQVFGFIERIENFAAVQIIVAFFIQSVFLIYYLKENISKLLKIKKENRKNILTYLIALTVPLISVIIFKNSNIVHVVRISPYILSIILLIVLILFISSVKKNNEN